MLTGGGGGGGGGNLSLNDFTKSLLFSIIFQLVSTTFLILGFPGLKVAIISGLLFDDLSVPPNNQFRGILSLLIFLRF